VADFDLRARVAAPPDTVFAVLTDHAGYARISPLRSATLEREGAPTRDGVGAVRRLALVGPPLREEVTEFEAPTRFAYRLVSGLPVREHTGEVTLTAAGAGTDVLYRVHTVPSLPVPDGVWGALVRPGIQQLLRGVVREAERRAGEG
jgi:uncharacterized protein YndB with AHSA1/START domain